MYRDSPKQSYLHLQCANFVSLSASDRWNSSSGCPSPLEMVAAILGNTVKNREKHCAHWVQSRQDALEKAVVKT
jgi:hypothetical protein